MRRQNDTAPASAPGSGGSGGPVRAVAGALLLHRKAQRRVLFVYAATGLALWAVPLFNLLHVESSAVVALVAFFAAGTASLRLFAAGEPLGRVLRAQELALVVPWALLTVTLLRVPNCGYLQGLVFYGLFPVVSVVLAVALAWALSGTSRRRPGRLFWVVGLGVALLTPLYDLGLHPQFYVYNHVFGGVLGPIYDEELSVRPGLFAFRGMTLLWALLLVLAGRRLRQRGAARTASRERAAVAAVLGGLGLGYLFSGPLGINTPDWYLQRSLGGRLRTEHFDIYYDPAALSPAQLRYVAADHEYRYARLAQRLALDVPARIRSYLYPDAETKARLTGARLTNVAPVWLPTPQVHVLLERYEDVFAHELVHVFSRAFGLPVLRASLSVGLVEGLAVALEPPDGLPGPHEQVAVALLRRTAVEAEEPIELAREVASRLSPFGFWTGRGAVSYTTMGSFVRYLLDRYGPAPLKAVYALGNFEEVYGRSPAALAAEWEAHLLALPVVARATADLVARRFSVPSLFEKPCPHYVPPYRRRYQAALERLARGDTAQAAVHLEASLARQPAYEPALLLWAQVLLARNRPEAVAARLDTLAAARSSPAMQVVLGDAHALLGQPGAALARYEAALARLPAYAHEAASRILLRKSLATYPAAVRTLVSGATFDAKAEALRRAGIRAPAVDLVRALLLAEAGRYDEAAALLRGTPPVTGAPASRALREVLARQRLVWLAQYHYRSGALSAAATYAEQARRAFHAVGDLDAAAYLSDFADRVRWAL